MELIQREMHKIAMAHRVQQQSDAQRVKAEMQRENGKVTQEEVLEELMKVRKRDFTSNFNATSRERWFEIFSNKTHVPCMGHYTPKIESVIGAVRNVSFGKA